MHNYQDPRQQQKQEGEVHIKSTSNKHGSTAKQIDAEDVDFEEVD